MWNPVDLKNESYEESMGIVKNIKNIDPPIRLFFILTFTIIHKFAKGFKIKQFLFCRFRFKIRTIE